MVSQLTGRVWSITQDIDHSKLVRREGVIYLLSFLREKLGRLPVPDIGVRLENLILKLRRPLVKRWRRGPRIFVSSIVFSRWRCPVSEELPRNLSWPRKDHLPPRDQDRLRLHRFSGKRAELWRKNLMLPRPRGRGGGSDPRWQSLLAETASRPEGIGFRYLYQGEGRSSDVAGAGEALT